MTLIRGQARLADATTQLAEATAQTEDSRKKLQSIFRRVDRGDLLCR